MRYVEGIESAGYVLKRALKYDPHHPFIAGIISPFLFNRIKLRTNSRIKAKEEIWDMIEREVSKYKDRPHWIDF